jgi:hypothetical protein
VLKNSDSGFQETFAHRCLSLGSVTVATCRTDGGSFRVFQHNRRNPVVRVVATKARYSSKCLSLCAWCIAAACKKTDGLSLLKFVRLAVRKRGSFSYKALAAEGSSCGLDFVELDFSASDPPNCQGHVGDEGGTAIGRVANFSHRYASCAGTQRDLTSGCRFEVPTIKLLFLVETMRVRQSTVPS